MGKYEDLQSKVAIVTGGSGDIGLAICRRLLECGVKVYATYNHNPAPLQELARQGCAEDGQLVPVRCDLTRREDVVATVEAIARDEQHVHILINNAGKYRDTLFAAMSEEEFEEVLRTNLYGTFRITKAVLPLLRAAKGASVVNISSLAGMTASPGQSNYSAAKAGVIGMGRSIAAELAGKGVRINTVAPGLIDSAMTKRVPRNIIRQTTNIIPLQRMGTPEEVASVVTFLCSGEASYVVGQTISVNGGLMMQ